VNCVFGLEEEKKGGAGNLLRDLGRYLRRCGVKWWHVWDMEMYSIVYYISRINDFTLSREVTIGASGDGRYDYVQHSWYLSLSLSHPLRKPRPVVSISGIHAVVVFEICISDATLLPIPLTYPCLLTPLHFSTPPDVLYLHHQTHNHGVSTDE
jgi:hypothetical protein